MSSRAGAEASSLAPAILVHGTLFFGLGTIGRLGRTISLSFLISLVLDVILMFLILGFGLGTLVAHIGSL